MRSMTPQAVEGADTETSEATKMEVLLFSLGTDETFGINVFKIREVCDTPPITRTPNMHANIEGLISLRGTVIPVLSLCRAFGLIDLKEDDPSTSMMVAEYNGRVLGFLVKEVDRIIQLPWESIRAPGHVVHNANAPITAISTLPDGTLISILDAETVLAQSFGEGTVGEIEPIRNGHLRNVFFADDSPIARKKIQEVLDALGVKYKMALNGREAWERLTDMAAVADQRLSKLNNEIDLILVDAEMPEMDGYQLTKKIKSNPVFNGIPVVMHSSLSSEANRRMGAKVGVDSYVPKFDADALAETMRPLLSKST